MRYKITTVSGTKYITTYLNDLVTEFSKEVHDYLKEIQYRKEMLAEAVTYCYSSGLTAAQIKTFLQNNRNQLTDYERGISADLLNSISGNAVLTAQQKTDLSNILTI